MRKRLEFGSVLVALLLLATACRTAAVVDYTSVPLDAPVGASVGQVSQAIVEAGSSLGWVMREEEPGLVTATFHKKSRMAVAQIAHDTVSFNIEYVDSERLMYEDDGGERKIHKNYNAWIRRLKERIEQRASLIYVRRS